MILKLMILLAMIGFVSSEEETNTGNNEVTPVVAKKCPNNDAYCLECNGSTCNRCGASFWNSNTGKCNPPKIKIDNCTAYKL